MTQLSQLEIGMYATDVIGQTSDPLLKLMLNLRTATRWVSSSHAVEPISWLSSPSEQLVSLWWRYKCKSRWTWADIGQCSPMVFSPQVCKPVPLSFVPPLLQSPSISAQPSCHNYGKRPVLYFRLSSRNIEFPRRRSCYVPCLMLWIHCSSDTEIKSQLASVEINLLSMTVQCNDQPLNLTKCLG